MKSIKPGRGPSMMSGLVGIFMICFGVLWTVMAALANPFFALFGVLWTGIAVVMTVHNFKNATGKNRTSSFDIVDASAEPDPFEERFGRGAAEERAVGERRFCPYCGAETEADFKFCQSCGKKLP